MREWDDLDDHMVGDLPDYDQPPDAPGDLETAARWARALRRHMDRLDRMEALYRVEKERLDGWLADRTAGDRRAVEWLESSLAAFHRARLEADPGAPKTLHLPDATVAARKAQPELVVDDQALAEWALAERRFELLRVQPNRQALQEHPVADKDLGPGEESQVRDLGSRHVDPVSGEVTYTFFPPDVVHAVGREPSVTVKVNR